MLLGADQLQSMRDAAYPLSDICGDTARAVQLTKRAIDVNPENATSWAEYSYSLSGSGEIQESFIALDKAEQLDPDALWVRYLLDPFRAMAHMRNGDWARGVQFAQQAVNDNPGIFWLQVYLANGLGLMGKEDEAREQWRLVKARFPGLTVEGCLWWFKKSMPEEEGARVY